MHTCIRSYTQPWGHAVAHMLLESLPKIILAHDVLLEHPNMAIHAAVPDNGLYDTAQTISRENFTRAADRVMAMLDDYLSTLGLVGRRLVYGHVRARRAWFVTPARCIAPQRVLVRDMRRKLRGVDVSCAE
jgi:hypothetical protein